MHKKPAKWKMAIITWLCIYPSLNVLLFISGPYLEGFHPLLKTLILTVILVPVMVTLLPIMQKVFSGWLSK